MFEEEAEEYIKEHTFFDEEYGVQSLDVVSKTIFKDGAEFGYNKAKEWHKGELPQVTDKNKETLYLAWTKYGRAGSPCIVTPLKVKYINLWTGAIVDKEDVVSWKEIELPTEQNYRRCEKMNEYFVTVSIGHYQHLPEIYKCFINAKSGEEAYEEARKQILERAKSWKDTSNELTGIELLDIRRL